jgi:hypothetical protein
MKEGPGILEVYWIVDVLNLFTHCSALLETTVAVWTSSVVFPHLGENLLKNAIYSAVRVTIARVDGGWNGAS